MRAITQLLLAAVLSSPCVAAPAAHGFGKQDGPVASPTASIDSGVVVGVQTSVANSPNLVNKYLGVPFAASPTRFAPAQTAAPWSEPYHATANGPACIQVRVSPSCLTIIDKLQLPLFGAMSNPGTMTDMYPAIQLS